MDINAENKIAQIKRLAQVMRDAVRYGAEAYANGIAGEKPIVDRHFTAGNQMRYGWAPLSREYFMRKQAQVLSKTKGGIYRPGDKKAGSKIDPQAGFQSSTGSVMGMGAAKNAPMLVLTGALRAHIVGPKHAISANGDTVTIRFANLPEYALYLQDGTAKMPQRSPVDPNESDRAEVVAAMQRKVDSAMGTGGAVAQSHSTIPGKARII